MSNIFSKQYKGLFHFGVIVLAAVANVLTNPEVVDLGWAWVGPVAAIVAPVLLFLQRFTALGEPK